MNTNVFVTLFDSNYLDKGLVLFDSLCKNVIDFKLYVIAFDDICFSVLSKIVDKRIVVISLEEFENKRLLEAKSNRTKTEYCWTCSSNSIMHVLLNYNEKICTYIDADMYFYCSPDPLFYELLANHSDVGVMRHGFLDCKENERYVNSSGEFCVEFNTFINNDNGINALSWWCNRCIEKCVSSMDEGSFGDQQYLEEMVNIFDNVHIYENIGGGVAPWNLGRFSITNNIYSNYINIVDRKTKIESKVIFYHFQQIRFISEQLIDVEVNMYPGRVKKRTIKDLYIPYMRDIMEKRQYLQNVFSLDFNKNSVLKKRTTLFDQIKYIIDYERNLLFALQRIGRFIFRKRNDYLEVDYDR